MLVKPISKTTVDTQSHRDSFNKYRMCIVIDEECVTTWLLSYRT